MNITSAKQLSAYLRDIRLAQQRLQSKVANSVGIKQYTVSRVELNPESTKPETLFKILAALELSIDVKPHNEAADDTTFAWKKILYM